MIAGAVINIHKAFFPCSNKLKTTNGIHAIVVHGKIKNAAKPRGENSIAVGNSANI
jgi:hypothetical protein